jgi:hypothetical protein
VIKKIGTIELLVLRVYPLDARNQTDDKTEVIVAPGEFDLYQEVDTFFWMMRGEINSRGFYKLGHGIFSMNSEDASTGIEVVFPSAKFSREDFAQLLIDPVWTEGHPEQRARINIPSSIRAAICTQK